MGFVRLSFFVRPSLSFSRPRRLIQEARVLVLSVVGIAVRCWRGEAWWFKKHEGVLRPNMAIITQALFSIFSACK